MKMPSFTVQIPNLLAVGPVVEIQISAGQAFVTAHKRKAAAISTPLRVSAMVDTGASASVIQEGLAAQLGLTPVGAILIHTASSTNVRCYEYEVQLVFPNEVVVAATAIEAPLQGQAIQCLIGRDVLSHGVLIYNGVSNLFKLSF